MAYFDTDLEHPKKRRRREITPKPVNARLVFDDQLKGNNASISEALWEQLGCGARDAGDRDSKFAACVAIAPTSPLHVNLHDSTWTILPLKAQPATTTSDITSDQRYQVRLAPNSSACQAFLKVLASVDHSRHGVHLPKSIEIRVTAAQPLLLDTIYVSVERGLLEKVDDIQHKFGGGFHNHAKGKKLPPRQQALESLREDLPLEDRLTTVVRGGLSAVDVLHVGDVFSLPLPAHPITHARPAPAIVLECEPVSQGRISSQTKIVVVQAGSSQEKAVKKLTPAPIIEESLEDTAEDTSNDQFFSAAEDRHVSNASEANGATEDDSVTEESGTGESDEDSDSMDDMISMSAPGLPPQPAGTLSSMTAATPRPGGYRASGTHTPGSVYSNFTATTAKAGSRPGKVFRTEALLRRVPAELLHPRPTLEDDNEAAVFVDTSTLAKIGCFSGDWVRIEVARNVSALEFSGLGALRGFEDDEESDWRAVRTYGLSATSSQKPRYAVDKTGERRSSFSHNQSYHPTTPVLYLSPVLLTNLSNASFVKVGALPKPPRQLRTAQLQRPITVKGPPLAKEVTLLMVSTPLTTNMQLQSALFSGLKAHFEGKKRILKRGDMIAVPVDEELGKTTASSAIEASIGDDDVTAKLSKLDKTQRKSLKTAWFRVQSVESENASDHDDGIDQDKWGDVAVVDSLTVRLQQAGHTIQTIPDAIEQWTRYWLGLRSLPPRAGRSFDPITTAADLPAMERMPLEKRIADLVTASTSPRAIHLGLPPLVILLHSNQRQVGKSYIATSACASIGLHTFTVSCHDLLSENAATTGGGDVKTEALLKMRAERALTCGSQQTALLLQYIDTLTADRMVQVLQEIISSSRVLIATTTKIDDIPAGIRSLFTHEFEVSAPDEDARESILRNASLATALPLSSGISLKNIALQTAALVAGDLLDVVDRAVIARSSRLLALASKQSCDYSDIVISGGQQITHLTAPDFSTAISAARSTFSDAIGAPKIPTVTWADVGGLASQKDAIIETISLPLTRPELFANGIRKRSGILFYGPPGTGKTLLAKAIATEFNLNFFSVKGPELLNMYIGESEANVRRVFQKARDARPCVVFFDELDSVAPKRGNQGDSGGVMDRIVSQLLAELDGMSGGSNQESEDNSGGGAASNAGGVFVIGATNRPDLLDPALLRPGRFDKMLYLGVADTHDSQVTILEALTRKFTLGPSVNLRSVANTLPFTYTGADLYALSSDAMLKAITRKTQAVDKKVKQISAERDEDVSTGWFFDHLATKEDIEVVVEEEDFVLAQRELVGSVSAMELQHFERIRGLFEENDISVGTEAGAKQKQQQRSPQKTRHSISSAPNEIVPRNEGNIKSHSTSSHLDSSRDESSSGGENDYGVSSSVETSIYIASDSQGATSASAWTNGGSGNSTSSHVNGVSSSATTSPSKSKSKGKARDFSFPTPEGFASAGGRHGFTDDMDVEGHDDEDLYS